MIYWLRMIILMIFDGILVSSSVYISLLLRFDGNIDPQFYQAFVTLLPWYMIISVISLYFCRLYHRMWQYASLGELYGIIKAITTAQVLVVLCIYTIPLPYLPRSVYIMSWVLSFGFIGGSRLGWRVLRDMVISEANNNARRALIIGAGDAGAMVARELVTNPSLNLQTIGFIDDSRTKQKLTLYGIPVMGNRHKIPQIVEHHNIQDIIFAMPSANGHTIREIIDICRETTARVRIFNGGGNLLGNSQKIRDIELEDLLRREPVKLNSEKIAAYLAGKTVLVTGAGGSIGSELCRQISWYYPKKLILVEYSENNLFDIENEIRSSFPQIDLEAELCDVKDIARVEQIFNLYIPQVVFHAAAHKHVPLMQKNPGEALKNNVLGTHNVSEMAHRYSSEAFILISTDKAVNPSSIMGATKRIAEMIIQDYNQRSETHYAAVRFGNVLGSRGSVIPTFEQQISQGGPVTITHAEMTRYFMTIPEAVQLVTQAAAMAKGGEIFILDMGEPVKIIDLARDLIHLHGYEPDIDIKLNITGIRPGEKLYEELFSASEQMAATIHDRIFISQQDGDVPTNLSERIEQLLADKLFINNCNPVEIIQTILPGFVANN